MERDLHTTAVSCGIWQQIWFHCRSCSRAVPSRQMLMSNRVWCHLAIWMSWAILCAGSFISLCRPHHRLPYVLSFRTTQSDPSTRGMGVPIRRGMARRAKSVDRCASHWGWGCMSLLLPGIMFQVFFGGLGCCRFYYGYIKTGVVQLMLFCAPGAALDGSRCAHIGTAEPYVLQPTPLAVDSCSHFILRQLRFGDPATPLRVPLYS